MKKINSEEEFEQVVLQAETKVVVDYYADWCGPCKAMAPLMEEVEQEHPEISFAKVNVDELITLAQKYKVISLPALLVFENGECVKKSIGMLNKAEVEELL